MSKAHSFTLGEFNCAILSDGPSRTMSLETTFPTQSQEELEKAKAHFAISTNDVEVGYNVLYIDTGTNKILVDCGLENGALINSLELLELKPEDIDTILITHGDSDHIGGMTNFPNAHFYYPSNAWEQWTNAESRKHLNEQFLHLFAGMRNEDELKAMEIGRENFGASILPSLKDRTTLVNSNEEVIEGIKFIDALGHRSDHFAVEVTSAGQSLIHVIDSMRHPFQCSYPWPTFIDSFPEQIVETNKVLVKRILEKNAQIVGAHFPFPALASLSEKDGSVQWKWLS